MEKKSNKVRTSFLIPRKMHEAMDVINRELGIPKSHQTEKGMSAYLKTHKDFLKKKGINLWKSQT